MGGRKRKKREPEAGVYIVGEGVTEKCYFLHLKKILGLRCIVRPRFFVNTSIAAMEKKIEELLRGDIIVICVFDLDVAARSKSEQKKLLSLQRKYQGNSNVLLCRSLPSIEYWFLLHYEETSRHFTCAKEAESALKKYLKGYEKTGAFLENEKWVRDLCSDGKLGNAIKRSKQSCEGSGSYTNMHEAFSVLLKNK